MSDKKKYYWLKLKDDFFTSKEVKKLRRVAGGDTYTIIYLKMQLLSIKNEGLLIYEGTETNLVEQLSLELDEEIDNIKITLSFLQANRLIEQLSEDEFLLNKVPECIGSETSAAERMRRMRAKRNNVTELGNKVTPLLQPVTKCYTEIEIEKEIEKEIDIELEKKKKPTKHKYGEYNNVLLSDNEMDKLKAEFPNDWEQRIERVSGYCASTGKTYKNYLATIRNWAKKEGHNGNTRTNDNKDTEDPWGIEKFITRG